MNKNVIEFKESLINSGLFKRVDNAQYRSRDCPICGDRKFHCYVKIDLSNDGPVVYHCFKCNNYGIVNDKFLEYIGLDNLNVPRFSKSKRLDVGETVSEKIMDCVVTDKDDIKDVCQYINDRVGVYPTLSDLQFFGYVGNPYKYTKDYLGEDINNVLNNRFWFKMTNGNIIGRWFNDKTNMRWLKYKSSKVSGTGVYKINIPVDMYQPINVIIAEGVMDVIGLYYNYKSFNNNIYIAALGKDYNKAISYVLSRGIFGKSVSVKIFKDSDVNNIYIDNNMRKLFKNIDIYQNYSAHDYGVTEDKMDIHKVIYK